MIFLLVFSFFSFTLKAPEIKAVLMIQTEPVNPYKRLIKAIGMVETRCDTMAYNSIEEATGFLQIRPVRLKDYNQRTGKSIRKTELYNSRTSEEIFLYYAEKIGPYDFEKIARRWNGSGHSTIHYWNMIRKYL